MPHARHSVTIERPVADVFRYVADGEDAMEWRPGVLDIERNGGAGVGTTYRQGVKGPMGRRVSADYEITLFRIDRTIEFKATAGPVRPRGRFDFESVDGGTLVTLTLDADLNRLQSLFIGSMVARSMASETLALQKLKQVLER